MKFFCLMAVFILCGLAAVAQTNAPDKAPRAPTRIDADSADFDLNGHKAIYHGHVRVDDPDMKLVCEEMVVNLPQAGERMNHLVAETNVVIDFKDDKGQLTHVTSDRAVYDYQVVNGVTNETVTFTGNPKMTNAQGTILSNPIVWDRLNNHFSFTNPQMFFNQGLTGLAATNAPAVKTNSPPATATNLDRTAVPAAKNF